MNCAPMNVMSHLPPPEGGGDKGGDLTTNSPTPGVKLLGQIAPGMPSKGI